MNKYVCIIILSAALFLVPAQGVRSDVNDVSTIGTFSIVAYDPEFREFGVAVQSKFLAVGSAVAFAAFDAGAIATQAWGNTTYGSEGLILLRMGLDAGTVVNVLTGKDSYKDFRQLAVLDSRGISAAFTGDQCQSWAGHHAGVHYSVQGNILTSESVIRAMSESFENSSGSLASRLIAALRAGESAGGDSRGRQSAALLVVRESGGYGGMSDKAIDLRVDDNPDPIEELDRLLSLHTATFGLVSYLQSYETFKTKNVVDAAEKCLLRAVVLAETLPDTEAVYLNAVAWTLVENNRFPDRAQTLAERALKQEPESPEIIDTLATILHAKGHIKQAIEWQRKAVGLKPNDPAYSIKLEDWMKLPADENIAIDHQNQ